MKYAFFLGCTIPARSRNYELSARKVAGTLGIDLVDVKEFMCCGFPVKASDHDAAVVMGAYNLAVARREGLDMCVLCSSCVSHLRETARLLEQEGPERDRVNRHLAKAGLAYGGHVEVKHFARILLEEVGSDEITAHCVKDLSGLRIAAHYGCHYLKPSDIYDGFDRVEDPGSIETLVRLTGASVVDYRGKKMCCGGPVLPVDERVALDVAGEKLAAVVAARADALCLVCPFCAVMFDGNQKSIPSRTAESYNLPVLYVSQLLGLAMGFDRKELGLNMNVVKTRELLAPFFEA